MSTTPSSYSRVWTREESLDSLNRRIHDGVAVEQLAERARVYRDTMFRSVYPAAQPQVGDRVLELGPGVGWIMEALLEAFPIGEIVGLDISENMARRARERFGDRRARFEVYDGLRFPFPDGHFQVVYSCAAIQHIPKHIAFILFKELHRVLQPGGHAVLHLLSTYFMPKIAESYEEECRVQLKGGDAHWHFFYSFDELAMILSNLIGVDDLDLQPAAPPMAPPGEGDDTWIVHFSKGTGRRYLRDDLVHLEYGNRLEREARLKALEARVLSLEESRPRRLSSWARRRVRQLAPPDTRRGAAVTGLARSLKSARR